MTVGGAVAPATDRPPALRGPVSEKLIALLSGQPVDLASVDDFAASALAATDDILADPDIQLALFLLYSLHSGPGVWVRGEWEWNPELLAARSRLESAFESELRERVALPELPASAQGVPALLFEMTAPQPGPSLSRFVAKEATADQLREFMVQRSIYTLREADPHSWAIPRLRGRSKVALVEIQSDEYGGGRPEWMHATIFARAMEGVGLSSEYGYYLDQASAETLASLNAMSMFGLQRRLRGAIVGHLAAFEMTSALPNRQYGNGFRRLGFGEDVTLYFDEHVEADAVHEQIAARDLAGSLAEDEPELLPDIIFGAAACLYVDDLMGDHLFASWTGGRTSLASPLP